MAMTTEQAAHVHSLKEYAWPLAVIVPAAGSLALAAWQLPLPPLWSGLLSGVALSGLLVSLPIVLQRVAQRSINRKLHRDALGQMAILTRGAVWETDARLRVERVIDHSALDALTALGQWIGRTLAQIDADYPANSDAIAALLTRRPLRNRDWYLPQAGGEPLRLRLNAWPKIGSGGRFLGYIGHMRPFVDRASADEALIQSERALRSLIDNFPGAVCLKDSDGVVLLHNRSYSKFQAAVVAGNDQAAETAQSMAEAGVLAGCHSVEFDMALDGSTFTFVDFPIQSDEGHADGVGSLIWDVTERRREQMELSQSRNRLPRFIENLPSGAALIDESGSLRINRSLETLTGY